MFARRYLLYSWLGCFKQNSKGGVFIVYIQEINGSIKHGENVSNVIHEGKHSSPIFSPIDDKTRVAIGENQDYINASYIRMQVGNEEFFYISCQGPLPSTVSAFWQMIWENKSDIIAMMTQEVERGRIKCHKYWPVKLGVPLDTGRYKLHLENQQYLEYFHIKVIRIVETEVRDGVATRLSVTLMTLVYSELFMQ